VKSTGKKSWQVRYKKPNGKWGWHGLGPYPSVTGAKARDLARQALARAADGIDLVEDKAAQKVARRTNTFRIASEEWLAKKEADGRSPSTLRKIRQYLNKDILPALGDKHLDEITRLDTSRLQKAIEERDAHNVAKKVRSWLNQIFGLAIANGRTENNPASELRRAAAKIPAAKHYPHLHEAELPAFLRDLRKLDAQIATKTACYLILMTGLRPGNIYKAEWAWFDLKGAEATIPAESMKMRRAHVVPLPTQLVSMLEELKRHTGNSRYLFPGQGWKRPHMSENTINKTFSRLGYKGRMTGHGARHLLSTMLNEYSHQQGFDRRHISAQLAHKDQEASSIANIYNHAQYLPERRVLMQWYANHLDGLESGKVAPKALKQSA
jgi:integrase